MKALSPSQRAPSRSASGGSFIGAHGAAVVLSCDVGILGLQISARCCAAGEGRIEGVSYSTGRKW